MFISDVRPILQYLGKSLLLIAEGLGIGMALAFAFSGLSVASEIFNTVYNLIVSICDLLPAVALMPILMITIGATDTTIIVLVVHSVVWPMSRSIIDGFKSVPKMHVESGRNIGLSRTGLIFGIYIPSSFSSIISGVRVGWARAWRGLISAEMIFGVASSAGIGTYINNARTLWLSFPSVYAALILIILVGVIVEYGIFANIEKHTVRKWGMVR
ncbi:MAG: ABC transporter permease subunit [Clostridia bacterium]|nr:ABC transporter permease subunit [Clostridia bacterium]